MFKRLLIYLIFGIFFFGPSKLSPAAMCGDKDNQHSNSEAFAHAASKKAVKVGNKICPVSGEKIDEKLKATYEYDGKIYNFCCASCIDEFKKDPGKYIKKVEEELQAQAKKPTEEESNRKAGDKNVQ